MRHTATRHWFPSAPATRRPSHWWYWGRALYVSRRDYRTTVRVDDPHPMVSLVAMGAPSPDWFTGVANVNLMEAGQWVSSRTIDLIAYDSGGEAPSYPWGR